MKINCPILFFAIFVLAFLSSVRPSRCFEANDMSWVLGMDENLENSGTLEGIVSADSVKVTGGVTDADGMAVEYVSVEIISVADTMSVAIGTFEEGRFIFNDIQPGKYRLNIYFMGYKPKSVTTFLSKVRDCIISISLSKLEEKEMPPNPDNIPMAPPESPPKPPF